MQNENEEVERLAVVMVARRDQIQMAKKITSLETRVEQLERRLRLLEDTILRSAASNVKKRRSK